MKFKNKRFALIVLVALFVGCANRGDSYEETIKAFPKAKYIKEITAFSGFVIDSSGNVWVVRHGNAFDGKITERELVFKDETCPEGFKVNDIRFNTKPRIDRT